MVTFHFAFHSGISSLVRNVDKSTWLIKGTDPKEIANGVDQIKDRIPDSPSYISIGTERYPWVHFTLETSQTVKAVRISS